MGTSFVFTSLEKLTLEKLARHKNTSHSKGELYRYVAQDLHVSTAAIANRLVRIRRRYDRAEQFAEEYRSFRSKVNKVGSRVL